MSAAARSREQRAGAVGNVGMAAAEPPFTQYIPLAAARRRYGTSLLLLALLGLLAIAALLLAQVPPSLRADTAALVLVLVVVFVGTGLLGVMWTWVIAWPRERGRLAAAAPAPRLSELPPSQERAAPAMAAVIGGGLLLGGLLWTVLNTLGFVAAPLLWCTLGAINLELARRVHRIEQRQGAIYVAVRAVALSGATRRLYVLAMP